MSVLDLQGMQLASDAPAGGGHGGGGSSHSNNSCTASDLSALLCGDHSVLSITLC